MAGYVLSAAAVAKLRRALAPKAGSSSRPGAGASPVASDNFSAPFAVRWSASEASGAWVMWLPDKTQCVSVAGVYVTPTGITAADDLPAGWYTIDNADAQSTALYLVLTTDDSTGATTAEIDTAPGTTSTGETVTNILISSLESDSETGAKRVRQFVVGTLALTPGGEEKETPPKPFEYVKQAGSILYRDFYWDGALVYAEPDPGFAIPANDDVYLKCVGTLTTSAPGADANGYVWTFTIGTTPATASGTQKVFNFKLYSFSDGEVAIDWRDTFLALWSGVGVDVEPDGVSIDKIPDAAPGATPDGDEGKLEIKGFKSAESSELTLDSNTATTVEFLARNPGNPKSLVFRKLKAPAGGITLGANKIVQIRLEWVGQGHQDFASHPYTFKVVRGELDITNNVLTVVEKANLAQYLPTTPLSQEANAS